MHVAHKIFGKTRLKAIRDTFFSNRVLSFLVGGDIQQKGKVKTFGLTGRPHPNSLPSCNLTIECKSSSAVLYLKTILLK